MTVEEAIKQRKGQYKSIWICPHIVSNQSITPNPILQGIECVGIQGIPKEIRDKKVRKMWKEEDMLCVIWNNV